jgi:hypothetical protein
MGLQMKSRIKGKFTFQIAGVLFVLSALLELFSINSRVPLFGNIQGGMIAATYHLIYIVLFSWLGFGLYRARSWAYTLVFVATALYTLDRLVYVLDRKALEIYLVTLLDKYGVTVGIPETGFILKVILLVTVLIVVCWWGFAGYTYLRRDYFHQPATNDEPPKTDVS